ncbi:alpha/beta fold hydrolase [Leptothoe sp. PORK10 BA2]|uniref:alpha/beta fold hydrolase n=1 Tax=Leptothoe sp. PORK10 BA2 TaxID=3110254 RepID=UPI002B2022D9|nr:alpha/beta fold hydrolase [Leptothoe sp. PORK10 BA2]MEA5462382.1 alpha/beta fold hydrolase [Leptothoe sp. PORK10 BA2]
MTISPPKELTRPSRMGGQVQHYHWTYQGQTVTIAYETLGAGPTVLLLPAFSTVSTRAELAQIAQVLASQFQVIALDWLGFGDSERPACTYERSLYQALLKDFVQNCCPQPAGILAAGHGAGYALHLAQTQVSTRLLLVAPTWKGPLRAMGAPSWLGTNLRNLVGLPIVGSALYGANTHPAFLKWMYQRHVFVDEARLTPTFIQQRRRITQQPGARFAPAAFVTAALDPMCDRTEWLQIATAVTANPNTAVRVILADQAPPQSKAEMQALSELPGIHTDHLPGSLGLYEEYGAEVGAIALAHFQA